jgi:hypothetical protein
MTSPSLVASIRQRLRNKAVESGEVFDFMLNRYAVERLIYRLSLSTANDQFVLEGALLFYVWNHQLHRPTRDLDFLGFGPADADLVRQTFQAIVATPVPDDGLTFHAETISADPIREDNLYGGIRVKILATLGNIRIPLRIDVGFGDAITPGPEIAEFPALLRDFPSPNVRAYPTYTVVAEKLQAMVALGDQNTRMKDFFDIRLILRTEELDPRVLAEAVRTTFERRKTRLPQAPPRSLTQEFAEEKEALWAAFLERNGITSGGMFAEVVAEIVARLPHVWAEVR